MAQNLQVLVSFSCYIIFFIRKQTKGWCFSFFQLLLISRCTGLLRSWCFSFFQLLPEKFPCPPLRLNLVLVSFSCYSKSTEERTYCASFSFFQLLQRGFCLTRPHPCGVLVSFSCYVNIAHVQSKSYRVLVSFSCYEQCLRPQLIVNGSFSFFQLLHRPVLDESSVFSVVLVSFSCYSISYIIIRIYDKFQFLSVVTLVTYIFQLPFQVLVSFSCYIKYWIIKKAREEFQFLSVVTSIMKMSLLLIKMFQFLSVVTKTFKGF